MNVQIVKAGLDQIPQIRELASEIWRNYYPEIITSEQIEYMLQKNYSPDALKQQMGENQHFYLILENNNHTGFLSVSQKSEKSYFIHKFYIQTSLHNKGIGAESFRQLLQKYPDAEEIRLQVNRKNYKPINFYFKMGFKIEYVADFNIGNGYFMNDFVMVWKKDFPGK